VISRIFDNPLVPKYAIEYLVYHEMLHLKHPVKVRGGRRCVHGPQFLADEKLFPQFEAAKLFLKRL
jgi:predicted metal-dependent hydrolase